MMKYSSLEPRLLDMFRSPMDSQADHLQGELITYILGEGGTQHMQIQGGYFRYFWVSIWPKVIF